MIVKVKSLLTMALFILGIAVLMCAMAGFVPDFHKKNLTELTIISKGP